MKFTVTHLRLWASQVALVVRNLPAAQETQVPPLGWKDPLEKEVVTHSSVLAGKSRGQRSLVGYRPRGCKESDRTERVRACTHTRVLSILALFESASLVSYQKFLPAGILVIFI